MIKLIFKVIALPILISTLLLGCEDNEKLKKLLVGDDTTAPTLELVGAADITVAHGSTYNDAGARAVDNVDGTSSVSTTDTVNTLMVGDYTLKYNATDSAGNAATQITRTVHVTDQTPPVITLNGAPLITLTVGSSYTDAGASVSDAVDGNSLISTTDTVNTSVAATYILKYKAVDEAGNNASEVQRRVQVVNQTQKSDYVVLASTNSSEECRASVGSLTIKESGSINGSMTDGHGVKNYIVGSKKESYISGAFHSGGKTSGSFSRSAFGDGGNDFSGTWNLRSLNGCSGTWQGKKAIVTSGLSNAEILKANPWYEVNAEGNCLAKYIYGDNDKATAYFGTNQRLPLTYTVDSVANKMIIATYSRIYLLSSPEILAYTVSGDTVIAFKDYQEALRFAGENGNDSCSSQMPE